MVAKSLLATQVAALRPYSDVVYLRATWKVLRFLGPAPAPGGRSNTALGDWFVNRLVVHRQPLLLLVSSASLLPILEPARKVRTLPDRLPAIVRRRLRELGIDEALISAEVAAMDEVHVAPTNDRSVVGTMVDFVHLIRWYEPPGGRWDRQALSSMEANLQKAPCRVTRPDSETVFPVKRTRQLLARRASQIPGRQPV